MSDLIDQTDERNEIVDAARLAAARAKPAMAPGTPGDCDLCGEWTGRLVGGACALCRDKHKLP